jgi:glycerophosphoryl diester phosphodiesterase
MRRRISSALLTAVVALGLGTPIGALADDQTEASSSGVADAAIEPVGTFDFEASRRNGPNPIPTSACKDIPPVHHRMWGIRGQREEDGNENTIWGMNQTYQEGTRWFETDVQVLLTKEEQQARRDGTWTGGHNGAMILFHDGTLQRTTHEKGRIRNLTYDDLPLTSDGRKIPTLHDAIRWIYEHPGTHLLVEVKMKLPWRRVNDLLDRYNFAGTDRIIFDIGKAGDLKYEVALKAAEHLNAITGSKNWPEGYPASWLTQFGRTVRLNFPQALEYRYRLEELGIDYRFSKVANGTENRTPQEQWAHMVQSGGFRFILTEMSKEYLDWCAAQQEPTS